MKFIFAIAIVGVLGACRNDKALHSPAPYLDSVIKEYAAFIDTFGAQWDYRNDQLEILKRYINKDTVYFQRFQQEFSEYKEFVHNAADDKSCFEKINLWKIDCNEAYQFSLEDAIGPLGFLITVYEKDSVYYYDYKKYWWGRGEISKCTLESHITRPLSKEEWNSLIKTIRFADFWGMRYKNGSSGIDGDYWTITGIRNRINSAALNNKTKEFHAVHRWYPIHTAFFDIGKYLIHLSGEKTNYTL